MASDGGIRGGGGSEMDEGLDAGQNPTDAGWSVRVRGGDRREARVYSGRNEFTVAGQATFSDGGAHPSAVEYLLGALGGDLVCGFQRLAEKRGLSIEGLESVVSGRLDNPMVFLGVVGAEGGAGFGPVTATLYVTSDEEEPALREVWRATLATSPLVNTLRRCVALSLDLRPTP